MLKKVCKKLIKSCQKRRCEKILKRVGEEEEKGREEEEGDL
jgi:hypothetical protein